MSEATATADRTAEGTSAENGAAADAEARAAATGTAEVGASQQPSETDGDNAADKAPPNPVDEAVSAGQKALIAEMAERLGLEGEFASLDELDAARHDSDYARREDAVEHDTEAYYTELARSLPQALKSVVIDTGYFDAEGKPVQAALTDDQIQKAVFPLLNDHRAKVRQAEQQANFDILGEAALRKIPETGHEAFLKDIETEGGRAGLEAWLDKVVEHAAPTSKAWAKRERDHTTDLKKEVAKAWKEGNDAPPGQAPQGGGTAAVSTRQPTWAQLQKMSPSEINALPADAWEKAKAAANG